MANGQTAVGGRRVVEKADAKAAVDLGPVDTFVRRHIGPSDGEVAEMLGVIGLGSLDELVERVVPAQIRMKRALAIGEGRVRGEFELLEELRGIAKQNRVMKSYIGQGYYDTIVPPVIQRNILENPGWYTQYTPYQAEIAQGRLEALLNFQTMVSDLVALPLANASLLDEGTAAAEAMAMCRGIVGAGEEEKSAFFVSMHCHPQTIEVVKTRGKSLGIEIVVGDEEMFDFGKHGRAAHATEEGRGKLVGVLLQYPRTDGAIVDYSGVIEKVHGAGALAVVAADLLALALIKAPGEMGADIAVGSAQRFGVPMGFGGPHAGFMATRAEYARKMPGRIVGVSKDAHGNLAYRLAIQTREQHIRREKATSNICTAQVLLAVMAGMYGVWHGAEGIKKIAKKIQVMTSLLVEALTHGGYESVSWPVFDTIRVIRGEKSAAQLMADAQKEGINLRDYGDGSVGISLDETTTQDDLDGLCRVFGLDLFDSANDANFLNHDLGAMARTSAFMTHPVFNRYHAEHEMLRYIRKLESRDLSLTHSMIPLGSCTMKLNATSEMMPVSWPEFGRMHPFAPAEQTMGYQKLFSDLEKWLTEITGFAAISLQPNAGSQGEYAGLLAIRGYHESRGEGQRDVCLIPTSAHGTNPASAVIAGMKVVAVACDEQGNIDMADLRRQAEAHRERLSCLMVTYPSTHGVFEETVKEICAIVHEFGGQVYMDGANMNAQVGLCRPGDIGADVCHLNLHKTFCIPHGGGGPGMGPIGVAEHLAPFLPPTAVGEGMVSAAPYGSALILVIPWVYIALMGGEGLTKATQVAILNANYMAKRLETHYPVLYRGTNGRCAHEFIVDVREFEEVGVKAEDIAKRLMDYGFHAPTMSWPVAGTLMIEPTESESKAELDRFVDAMVRIRGEIRAIEEGRADKGDNVLKGAPHTAEAVAGDEWKHKYGREEAAYPAPWVREHKFWPAVGRIDNPYGDRNLVCACPQVQ